MTHGKDGGMPRFPTLAEGIRYMEQMLASGGDPARVEDYQMWNGDVRPMLDPLFELDNGWLETEE